jgi:hypothetical protein
MKVNIEEIASKREVRKKKLFASSQHHNAATSQIATPPPLQRHNVACYSATIAIALQCHVL